MKFEPIETSILKKAMKLSSLIYNQLGQEQEAEIAKSIEEKIEGAEDEAKRKRLASEAGEKEQTERS